MSSAEHVFDVVIVAPGKDGMPPVVLYHAPAIGAKDEGAAKVKAVEAAREAKVVFDIDFVEILVTRQFVDKVDCVVVTWPAYVPAIPYTPPVRWVPPIGTWPQPYPDWYATQTGFTSGYLSFASTVEEEAE